MPHYYYKCSICGATLTTPTKDKLVSLMLTHARDHHGLSSVKRPELQEWEKEIKTFEPEGPQILPPVAE